MMSDRDRVKLLKPDNKQLGRKTAARILHIKSRFCILLSLFLTTLVLVTLFNNKLQLQSQSLHQYVRGFFDPRNKPANMMHKIADEDDNFELLEHNDDFDLVWEDDTIAMFQDHLGLVVDEDSKVEQCHLAERQVAATALPGPNNEDLYEALWQFISLFALQAQTLRVDDYGREFTLKAFVTEQMRIMLDQLFEGDLPLEMLSHLPQSCYNLRYSKIIGNITPINLNAANALLLLNPRAKRTQEIAKVFNSQTGPMLKFKQEIMDEVLQEFLVTKTIQELENEKTDNVLFVGMYLTSDDKLPLEYYQSSMDFYRKNDKRHQIFMVICDAETLAFCKESFSAETSGGVDDVRVLKKSSDTFDSTLLAHCNATIISNEMGAMHALLSGTAATVFHPPDSERDFYLPWILKEQMTHWRATHLAE